MLGMKKTVSTPRGGVHGVLAALAGVATLGVFVVMAMVDLFALYGVADGSGICDAAACRARYRSDFRWTLGICALSFVVTLAGFVSTACLRRRRFVVGVPVLVLGLALQVPGLGLV
ncbi:hypothetical protein ACFRCG_38035 [Embleya sp. NPDC056575]|uniref:hypothetical protein n=1 Tax=unclassified Embleya TaxID=2699296 RepID=UPI0036A80164